VPEKIQTDTQRFGRHVLPVGNLALRCNEMNRAERALHLYLDELGSLPFDAPYHSFGLAENVMTHLIEAGCIAECRTMIERYSAGLRDTLALHENVIPHADSTAHANDAIADAYQDLIDLYDLLHKRLDLIDTKAPALSFEHVYKADSTLALDDLTGKVVAIDF
jgi:hypothetical protein